VKGLDASGFFMRSRTELLHSRGPAHGQCTSRPLYRHFSRNLRLRVRCMGTNRAVIEMLMACRRGGGCPAFHCQGKGQKGYFRLMGFGNRVYKTTTPRQDHAEDMRQAPFQHEDRDRFWILPEGWRMWHCRPYFIDHHLYPNMDFYSGIFLRLIGIPLDMFTTMFAIGRLPDGSASGRRVWRPMGKLTG